jgi:hypothetical protein
MAHTQSAAKLSPIRKSIRQAATAAFALIVFSCILRVIAAQECQLFHYSIWVALQLLRPALLAAKTAVPAHPCQAASVLQHLLQIVAANWPLPQALVG